jgi:hypothetical protein
MELRLTGDGMDVTQGWKTDRRFEWSIKFTEVGKRKALRRAGEPVQEEAEEFNVVAEGDEIIPTQPMLEQQATVWIEQVWGAQPGARRLREELAGQQLERPGAERVRQPHLGDGGIHDRQSRVPHQPGGHRGGHHRIDCRD